MRELFERLRDGGEAAFERLREDRVEEDLQLDFKSKSSPDRQGMNDDDKRYLGEALSGFSNSAGGLLVFGVNCRVGTDGVDCVQGLVPLVEPESLASDIRSMLGSFLQPSNDGVEVASVNSTSIPGRGYVLVWVPRSERRPHQSRAKGHFKYFKRNGRDFHPMEHYDLEDSFARISAPRLSLLASPIGGVPYSRSEWVYNYQISLFNASDHVAKLPYISILNAHGCGINQRYYDTPYKVVHLRGGGALVGGVNDVIHPGLHDIAGQIAVIFSRQTDINNQPVSDWAMMGQANPNDGPSFEYIVGCEGMRGERGRWSTPREFYELPR